MITVLTLGATLVFLPARNQPDLGTIRSRSKPPRFDSSLMDQAHSELPVTLLTGFLGAETTLLNHILSNQQGVKTAVLVNEFGEIGIDNDLIIATSDDRSNSAMAASAAPSTGSCWTPSIESSIVRIPSTIWSWKPRSRRPAAGGHDLHWK